MNTKTIVARDIQEFDRAVSTASKALNGKFTQTHVGFSVNGEPQTYIAVVFYEGND